MTDRVRVRFAPSPTGQLHVGNIRTALFTWLFARHSGGSFIVRIEDTDQKRNVEGATEELLDGLAWLGLDADEGPVVGGEYGPYIQSQRLPLYRETADRLIDGGSAYSCYCSPGRLDEIRRSQAGGSQRSGYDGRCRKLDPGERRAMERQGAPLVVRFKMPADGVTVVNDLVRGEVSFENRLTDDFVILKSDGFPTYHLAHLVDDHAMEISHVLRAEDWLTSTPRHIQIYSALKWQPPQFAHVPMILAPDRSKLSKRHGATSVLEYRAMGYLPEAMTNFLALLGWSLDDQTDLISRDELVRHFSIDRIGKSASIFRVEKLDWMDGHYIRQLTPEDLAQRLLDFWGRWRPPEIEELPDSETVQRLAPLIQERIKTLKDAAPLVAFFFKERVEYETEALVQKGMDVEGTKRGLEEASARLRGLPSFDAPSMEVTGRAVAQELGVKAGQLFGSLRIATTGQRIAPPLFETMEVLGRERTLRAIDEAITRL